ncbi:MAG: FAD-dependent tricarballylate dehydrogenase TcuA [Albidovulum sp.]|nr:FAD-dependent tricarballylate dehydrogenase TcuA [Albidovulum sp.]MDE0305288.1 FAD-dependent tricarballylate dehydrogenase TcuA [Albidovulum sp.]
MNNNQLVVVGSGSAAMVAAMIAHDEGCRKIRIVEKAPEAEMGGNTRFTPGFWRFAFKDQEEVKSMGLLPQVTEEEWKSIYLEPYSPEDYFNSIMKVGEGKPKKEFAHWIADESNDITRYLTSEGFRWQFATSFVTATDEDRTYNGGLFMSSKGLGPGLIDMQLEALRSRNLEVECDTAAVDLLRDNGGAVIGIRARMPDGSYEDIHGVVILASGGFEANPEMRTRYLGPEWNIVKTRGTRFNTGEMMQAAFNIGAQAFGHIAGTHSTCVDTSSPELAPLELGTTTTRISHQWGVLVNRLGKRFTDEGFDWLFQSYVKVANDVIKQPGNVAYQIFDSKVFGLLDKTRYPCADPAQADTIEELADKIDIDKDEFLATIHAYNGAVDDSVPFDATSKDGLATVGLSPNKTNWAQKMDTPPYRAYPVESGITFTFGGLKQDMNSRILDFQDKPIEGLYGCGEITGGFFYTNYPAGSGLVKGAVTARAAARHAAHL